MKMDNTKKLRRFTSPLGEARYAFLSRPSLTYKRYETALVVHKADASDLVTLMTEELSVYLGSIDADLDKYEAAPLYKDIDDGQVLFNMQRRNSAPFILTPDGESVRDKG